MAARFLRADCSSGESWDDPSEDLLFMLLEDIACGDEEFVIVKRVGDWADGSFAQVARNADGTWVLEHGGGSLENLYTSDVPEMRETHRVLTEWAFDLPGWQSWERWTKVDLSTWTGPSPRES